jgi:hypothetical protein
MSSPQQAHAQGALTVAIMHGCTLLHVATDAAKFKKAQKIMTTKLHVKPVLLKCVVRPTGCSWWQDRSKQLFLRSGYERLAMFTNRAAQPSTVGDYGMVCAMLSWGRSSSSMIRTNIRLTLALRYKAMSTANTPSMQACSSQHCLSI